MEPKTKRPKRTLETYRDMGASSVKFHPDGSIAEVVFAPKVERYEKPKLTVEQAIAKDREYRNPRRDALELAEEILNERSDRVIS